MSAVDKAEQLLVAQRYIVGRVDGEDWDLVAVGATHIRLVRVLEREPFDYERESIVEWAVPRNVARELWVWSAGDSIPRVVL